MAYEDKREGGEGFKGARGGARRDDRHGGDRDRRPRGERKFGDKSRGDRPQGGRGSARGFGDKRAGGRGFGDKRGDRQRMGKGPKMSRYDIQRAQKPRVGTSDDLKEAVGRVSGRGYSAYKEISGRYSFENFELCINHVQADPFASPSQLSVRVRQDKAAFPHELYSEPHRRVALEDALLRNFSKALARNACRFSDMIKGGDMLTSRPGPEVLKRTACSCTAKAVEVCFQAALPARDRMVVGRELSEMLFEAIPACVEEALLYENLDAEELEAVANLADDQQALREALEANGWVCFVADGAVLPRESGVSSRPMANAKPFSSPDSLRATVELPHAGSVTGMAVPRGVTLIVGGGYHGKSTLLKAIQSGVYNHVAGDGREFVVCDSSAVKLRAEDGRSVRGTDISLFISNLPNAVDTTSFWTENASGSTSQAAFAVEALNARARTLLIDEDTSATNFMVRDDLMQAVVAREDEPITPFVERMRDLYEKAGVSTILVAGSSGAFFPEADLVIQMDCYEPSDITDRVRAVCAERGVKRAVAATAFSRPETAHMLVTPPHPLTRRTAADYRRDSEARREGRAPKGPERLKVKVYSGVHAVVGNVESNLRGLEQLVDAEQAETLAHIVRWCQERDLLAQRTVPELVEAAWKEIDNGGLNAVSDKNHNECGMALPRKQEAYACLARLRARNQ